MLIEMQTGKIVLEGSASNKTSPGQWAIRLA